MNKKEKKCPGIAQQIYYFTEIGTHQAYERDDGRKDGVQVHVVDPVVQRVGPQLGRDDLKENHKIDSGIWLQLPTYKWEETSIKRFKGNVIGTFDQLTYLTFALASGCGTVGRAVTSNTR